MRSDPIPLAEFFESGDRNEDLEATVSGGPADRIAAKALASLRESSAGRETLDEGTLRLWLARMAGKGLSAETVRRYYGKVRALAESRFGIVLPLRGELTEETGDSISGKDIKGKRNETGGNRESGSEEPDGCGLDMEGLRALARALDAGRLEGVRLAASLVLYSFYCCGPEFDWLVAARHDSAPDGIPYQARELAERFREPRRRYLFPLEQGRRGVSTVRRELRVKTLAAFSAVGHPLHKAPSTDELRRLWGEEALARGIDPHTVRAVLQRTEACSATGRQLPPGLEYLGILEGKEIGEEAYREALQRVADSVDDRSERWFPLCLRRTRDYLRRAAEVRERSGSLTFFYPTREIRVPKGKRFVKAERPYLPGIMFVKCREDRFRELLLNVGRLAYGLRTGGGPGAPWSTVPDRQMAGFQLAVGQFAPGTEPRLVTTNAAEMRGKMVRVTGGPLAGYEGEVLKSGTGEEENTVFLLRLSTDSAIRWEARVQAELVEIIDVED